MSACKFPLNLRRMRTTALGPTLLLLLLPAMNVLAQRYKMVYTPGTNEGELLELIEHQIDTHRKIDQIERFLQRYPNHGAVSHLLEYLQSLFLRANEPDKSLAYGEQLLARHPLDLDAMFRCQKAAEMKKDQVLVKAWEDRILQLAKKLTSETQPKDIDPQVWKQSVEIAQGMLEHREYDEFTKALEASPPKVKAAALEDFARKYSNSKYLPQIWPHLMNLYRSMGDTVKAVAAADKILAADPGDPDALLISSQIMLDRRSNYAKIVANGQRVLKEVPTRAKPANYSEEEWEQRKNYYLGSANMLIGNTFVNQNVFPAADRYLRQALVYLKGGDQTHAALLFYIGYANYYMENYKEAAAFFRQCMQIPGPFNEQASRNLGVMKAERRLVE